MSKHEKKDNALVKNVADKKQVDEAQEQERIIREEELNDLVSIMSTVEGRRFIFRLVNGICHYDADDFNNSGSITFRSLGERNVGRVIKGDCCEASLELYQQAEKENWKFLQNQGE